MSADLPNEFDVIVLGTGMPESIAAAAFSRIGQTVLHLDRNGYYSGDWASFNLQGIEKWAQHKTGTASDEEENLVLKRPEVDEGSLLQEGEQLIELPLQNSNFSNIELKYHTKEEETIKTYDEDPIEQDGIEKSDFSHSKDKTSSNDSTEDKNDLDTHTISGDSNEKEDPLKESDKHTVADVESKEDKHVEGRLETQQKSLTEIEKSETDDRKEIVEKLFKTDISQETADVDNNDTGKIEKIGNEKVENCDKNICDIDKKVDSNLSEEKLSKEINQMDNIGQDSGSKDWTEKSLKTEWRKFNLDLSPKVLYCGGEMVELLISSDIAKYCEFKTVTRVLTVMDGKLDKVPCSRADVFSSKKVSMLEKRMLMKFLQFCLEYETKTEEIQDFMDKPFSDFLSSRKLTANLKHFVQHSIAMATDSMTTKQGLERTQKFLRSVGRYGNTAFLWSLYGSGELPQSFCRMCAVFGGVYCLRMSASSVIIDKDNKCKGIITTEGQRIACKWLIMESSYSPAVFLCGENRSYISRGILVTDKPLLSSQSDTQELSMLCIPCPDDGDRPVFVLELPHGAMACPPGVYVFHLTRQSRNGSLPKDDLKYALDILFQKEVEDTEVEKPRILWSLYFTQVDNATATPSDRLPDNVFLMSGPSTEVDIDRPVQEARELFKKILPDEEFLPKAPNPEDIIYVDDSETKVTEDSSQSEFVEQESSQSEVIKVDDGSGDYNQSKPNKDLSNTDMSTDMDQSQAGITDKSDF